MIGRLLWLVVGFFHIAAALQTSPAELPAVSDPFASRLMLLALGGWMIYRGLKIHRYIDYHDVLYKKSSAEERDLSAKP